MRLTHHSNFLRAIQSLLLLLLLVAGSTHGAILPMNSKCSSAFSNLEKFKEIPEHLWIEVPTSRLVIAKAEMQGKPYVQVQPDAIFYLLGQTHTINSKSLFLFRALYRDAGTGSFRLQTDGKNLRIEFGYMGNNTQTDRETLILIGLPAKPECVATLVRRGE